MYLNCKTYFSFRYGTMSSRELIAAAIERGVFTLALTNINSTCDIWDFVEDCRTAGIKPIAGAEIRNGDDLLYILLSANNSGLEWIHSFISHHLQTGEPFPSRAQEAPFFYHPQEGFVIYPLNKKKPDELFSNERIGIMPCEVNKLFVIDTRKYPACFVIRQPVTFLNKKYFNLHRLLRAIDKNTLLSKLSRSSVCGEEEYFRTPSDLLAAFSHYPDIVTNTYQLMDACNVEMDFGTDKNKKVFSASPEDDRVLLAKLAREGLLFRYGPENTAASLRLERELKIIDKLGFNAYFLITWDIVRYAQSRGFYYVGRGSGANSIAAYCLRITDVDPIELDLYFERFLNPYRASPPDFDIDFSWTDRDEVIDYVFKRYGKKHVALLGMYATFKYRAAVRELGKVFGLPKEEIDLLAAGGKPEDSVQTLVLKYGILMENFPNHLSIHPGGVLICEEAITRYATIFMPPKGFPAVQIDMFAAEKIGLYKLDILSQRGLGHIKECLRLIKQNRGVDIDIHAFQQFKNNPQVAHQIRSVNTIGCFYIESPAMRQLLSKLRCSDYLTLVAASSIIRPGVASSGMMRAYIERYHAPENIDYVHPVMKELLQETYGVMVYQEDVIKVAHHFAGLDMGEADILRRAMSGKYRGSEEMQRIRKQFFINCRERQYPEDVTAEIWRQIESFGGYSFSKAHSASFAVESYQSLYLKTFFPKEFMVAVINNFGGFYSTELYFLELRKTGADIHLPDVNESDYFTRIQGNDVYTGFVHIKSLQKEMAEKILSERSRAGRYLHLQDFLERTTVTKEQLNILISIGAFGFTGKSKKKLLWEANFLQKRMKAYTTEGRLFEEEPLHFSLPSLPDNRLDDLYDEIELLDFPLSNPFEMAEDVGKHILSADLPHMEGQVVTVIGYFIDYKSVRTIKGEQMAFCAFLDAQLDWIDTVHFPGSLRHNPLQGKGFYKLTGKVVNDFGVYSIEINNLNKVGYRARNDAL